MKSKQDLYHQLDDDLKSLYGRIENSVCDYSAKEIDLKTAVTEILYDCLKYTKKLIEKDIDEIHVDGFEQGFNHGLKYPKPPTDAK